MFKSGSVYEYLSKLYVLGEKQKIHNVFCCSFTRKNEWKFLIERLVHTLFPLAQLPLGAQGVLAVHSDPHSVCADVTQPSDTNHLILYISFLRNIQI